MTDDRRCETCHEWIWSFSKRPHVCPPAFEIWCVDDDETEEDARTYYAHDANAAVEKWADMQDCHGDYYIVQGATPTLGVRPAQPFDAPITYHTVDGEMVPEYHACEVDLDHFKRELLHLVRSSRMYEAGRLYRRMHTMTFHTRSET